MHVVTCLLFVYLECALQQVLLYVHVCVISLRDWDERCFEQLLATWRNAGCDNNIIINVGYVIGLLGLACSMRVNANCITVQNYENYENVLNFVKVMPKILLVPFYLLHASSLAAYRILLDEKVLCLPSVTTLRRVTRMLNAATKLNNSAYLQLLLSKLNEYVRTVVLIIDEIYVAHRVEYSGGDVVGLTSDGRTASTLLCFMMKSVSCQ